MPTKRPDESQDAFVIRCIRDDEAEACLAMAEELRQAWLTLPAAEVACRKIADVIRQRIRDRAEA